MVIQKYKKYSSWMCIYKYMCIFIANSKCLLFTTMLKHYTVPRWDETT